MTVAPPPRRPKFCRILVELGPNVVDSERDFARVRASLGRNLAVVGPSFADSAPILADPLSMVVVEV